MKLVKLATALCCVALPTTAGAQAVVFPPEAAWVPLRCGGAPMSDRLGDEAGAIDERDLVGDAVAPAGLRARDATHLFLRLRLDEDPAPLGALRPFAWGMQFDTDDDRSDYEVMVMVDGVSGGGGTVALFRNTTTTMRNDPADPADPPAVETYPFAMNARVTAASGAGFGGSPDAWLDFAVPWSALATVGLVRTTPTYVWAATSSVATGLDADLACHDGATGAPVLDGTASDPTTGDPAEDPGPGGPGGTGQLQGGGGCAAGGGGGRGGAGALVLLALALVEARGGWARRRGPPRAR
jgi:hypothetical protein